MKYDWLTYWMNECVNERTKERMNEWTIECLVWELCKSDVICIHNDPKEIVLHIVRDDLCEMIFLSSNSILRDECLRWCRMSESSVEKAKRTQSMARNDEILSNPKTNLFRPPSYIWPVVPQSVAQFLFRINLGNIILFSRHCRLPLGSWTSGEFAEVTAGEQKPKGSVCSVQYLLLLNPEKCSGWACPAVVGPSVLSLHRHMSES